MECVKYCLGKYVHSILGINRYTKKSRHGEYTLWQIHVVREGMHALLGKLKWSTHVQYCHVLFYVYFGNPKIL